MRTVTSVAAMQRRARHWRRVGRRIGFVPTMGYLHAGHLSLVRRARQAVGKRGAVVVSLYVNPTQFAPTEDLNRYPRDLKRDLALCREAGVDAVFTPNDAEMYPGLAGSRRCQSADSRRFEKRGYSTYVIEEQLSQTMEGAARPTHFRGVMTVVAKLFNVVLPHVAVFGAKDWQQAAIIRRMVADLNFPVKIIVASTVREPDGLAMSSRNKYLDAEQRAQATVLHRALQRARARVGRTPISAMRLKVEVARLIATAPQARLDYVEFFDPETLTPVATVSRGAHLALAVFIGNTRLIDNARL